MNTPCQTCFYKETGPMRDPCFPCLHEYDIFSGQPKRKYDAWVDESIPAEEVARKTKEDFDAMDKACRESPEIRELLKRLFGRDPYDESIQQS